MKRTVWLLLFLLIPFVMTAQMIHYDSEHYRITTDVSESFAHQVAAKMEAAYQLFAELFHFEPENTLRVTIFRRESTFDDYLARIISEDRDDFVYVHYADSKKSELVGFVRDDDAVFDSSLLHQGCIQYMKAHIPHPPVWLREGTATYFEKAIFSADTGRFHYKPNLAWLQTLKDLLNGSSTSPALPLDQLLLLDNATAKDRIDVFYPEAWAAVAFLMESDDRQINRIFFDALNALDPGKSLHENSRRVREQAFDWYDEERLVRQFLGYVDGLRTFNELIQDGTDLYADREYETAEETFVSAMRLEPENHVPYYYVGLINYAQGDYQSADVLFRTALDLGADKALTNYALGVNAFAGNQFDVSKTYLTTAKQTDPRSYGTKVDSLLTRISTLR